MFTYSLTALSDRSTTRQGKSNVRSLLTLHLCLLSATYPQDTERANVMICLSLRCICVWLPSVTYPRHDTDRNDGASRQVLFLHCIRVDSCPQATGPREDTATVMTRQAGRPGLSMRCLSLSLLSAAELTTGHRAEGRSLGELSISLPPLPPALIKSTTRHN